MRGRKAVGFSEGFVVTHADGLHPASHSRHRTLGGGFITVELDHLKATRPPERVEQLGLGIHDDRHAVHQAVELTNPLERIQGDVTRGAGKKIEAQRVGAGFHAIEGVLLAGDSTDFDMPATGPEEPHSITRASAFLIEG